MSRLPERLKHLRLERNLSQLALGELLNIPRATLTSWEIGRRTPDANTLEKFADFYCVSIDYLFGKTNIKNRVNIDDTTTEIMKMINNDPELYEFMTHFTKRPELQVVSKKIMSLTPSSIEKLVEFIDNLKKD